MLNRVDQIELDRTYRIGARVLLFAGTVAFWTVIYLIVR